MTKGRAQLMVLAAASLWGLIGLFVNILSARGFSSMQIVALRAIITCICIAGFLALRDPEALRVELRDLPYFIGTGVFSIVLFTWCYFSCIARSSISVAVVLLYTAPIFVMLLSVIVFREKLTGKKLLALAMTFSGCMCVTGFIGGGAVHAPPAAVLLGIASGFCFSLYSIIGKIATGKYRPETVTAYTFIFASIAVIPFIVGGWEGVSFDAVSVLALIAISVLCCVTPFVLYTAGLANLEPERAAIISTMEPVVGTLVDAVLFHQTMTALKPLGLVLVVGSIIVMNVSFKRPDSAGA